MAQLPMFIKSYFWDVDFDELQREKHWFLVLKRVLDRGNTRAIRWAIKNYGQDRIREVVTTSIDLSPQTANFWASLLGLPRREVPCLNKPYSPIPFGLSS